MEKAEYICLTCKATKTIEVDKLKTPTYILPEYVICGWRGCDGRAVRL